MGRAGSEILTRAAFLLVSSIVAGVTCQSSGDILVVPPLEPPLYGQEYRPGSDFVGELEAQVAF